MSIPDQIFGQHNGKSVMLDSNLLLVLLAGSLNPRLFKTFDRIQAYTMKDFQLLKRVLRFFTVLITTPHILTEVGNLANKLPEHYKPEWQQHIASLIASKDQIPGIKEHWTAADQLCEMPEFMAFGITDAALANLADEALILTEDHRLSGALRRQGRVVLNFNELRKLTSYLL